MTEKQDILDLLYAYSWNDGGMKVLPSGEAAVCWWREEERVFIKDDGNWCYQSNTTLLQTLEGKPSKVYGYGRESLDAFISDDWAD